MKDAKGHGSNAHNSGIEAIGRAPMAPGMWYHGSASGQPGATGPVHVGTALAAKQALEARIGIPADGRGWDGSRQYGKTLLAGQDTLDKMAAAGYNGGYPKSGYNCRAPKNDYYATDRTDERAAFTDKTPVPFEATPAVHSYNIVGPMSNSTNAPYADARANGMANRLKNKGVFYKNEGEDGGSVSAIVPSAAHLRRAG